MTKTELMHLSKGSGSLSLVVRGDSVHFVTSFVQLVHLGWTETNNCDLKPEIDRRRAPASSVMQALRNPLWRQQAISRTTE